jgi:hypothetical protein
MVTRTIKSTVTFGHAFNMPFLDTPQPAGTYAVEIDEEQIEGLSFLAYRQVSMLLHLPAIGSERGREQVVTIEPEQLAAALERDTCAPGPPSNKVEP